MPEAVPVVIPETLWEPQHGEEAVLVGWLAADGAAVQAGERVAEIMVDKVTLDVEAPASGRLAIRVPVDAEVQPGDVIAHIQP
ncbi:MAG: lipoyl domain-containing protein [Rhodothermales bacterium]|nr:lipoyl domain-containing protein [Rhodothermales bacterium]